MSNALEEPAVGHTQKRLIPRPFAGYAWTVAGVGAATACFWLAHPYLDKGHASLLYLPVVIACSIWFGFGPAVLGAILSFLCWDFFLLPPYHTLAVSDPKDWLSLLMFLLVAISTARLASQAQLRAEEARSREAEISTLYHASESISREIIEERLLPMLAAQVLGGCQASRCIIFRRSSDEAVLEEIVTKTADGAGGEYDPLMIRSVAQEALEHDLVVGFGASHALWSKALSLILPDSQLTGELGVYIPLRAQDRLVGVMHVGPHAAKRPYSPQEERLIHTLANHAAVVIARQKLASEAAQAEALREADALKETLLSLVSHELRTPLAAIKAAASGLLQPNATWEEAGRNDALATIDTEADRLTEVVSNLLDLSRLEAGAWKPERDWCDPAEIVSTALDRLPLLDVERVRVHASEELPFIRVDYVQIALVLTNLLQNALKYTPPGSAVDLTLAVEGQSQQAGGRLSIVVRDYGAGIDSDEAALLFKRFYRGAKHQRGTVHGTGLGLALCEAIVRAHGGTVHAGNAPIGEPPGALFAVTLPIDQK